MGTPLKPPVIYHCIYHGINQNRNENNKHINLNCHQCLVDRFLINSFVLLQTGSNFIIHPELHK